MSKLKPSTAYVVNQARRSIHTSANPHWLWTYVACAITVAFAATLTFIVH